MTCTPLTDPLCQLLDLLAGTTGAPATSLNRDGLVEARRCRTTLDVYGHLMERRADPLDLWRRWRVVVVAGAGGWWIGSSESDDTAAGAEEMLAYVGEKELTGSRKWHQQCLRLFTTP
jgi:hypothetical protein